MSANPLFEKWLFEWREDELNRGSNMHFPYAKAVRTLQKCPVQLESGSECLLLKNFGQSIVDRLDYKLAAYRRMHPSDVTVRNPTGGPPIPVDILKPQYYTPRIKFLIKNIPREILKVKKPRQCSTSQSTEVSNGTNLPRRTRGYCPRIRSGPYAILIAMMKEEEKSLYPGFLTKAEIIGKAQPYCDASFTRLENGKPCAAWAGINTLCKKSLVTRWSNPAKFKLTDNGAALARQLIQKTDSLSLSSCFSSTNHPNHDSSMLNSMSDLENHIQMYDEDNISDAETVINDDLDISLLSPSANSPNQYFGSATTSSMFNLPSSGLQIHGDNINDANVTIDDEINDPFVNTLCLLEGITVEKARLIVKRYPNPSILTAVYESSADPENLLSDIIGSTLSKSVCQLYYY